MVEFNLNIISGSKTEGVAGTYCEDEIAMPNSPKSGLLPALVGIEIEYPLLVAADNSGAKIQWALATKSNDAIPDLDDEEVIVKGGAIHVAHTEVGAVPVPYVERITFPAPIPISVDKIYFQIKGDGVWGGGAALTLRYRLLWVPRYVSGAKQRNSIMNQSTQF